MYRLITFIALSAALAYLSRTSLSLPRSHGFHRFFAAEFLLALLFLNLDHWFVEPFSIQQVVSWLLLTVSTALVLSGALTLKVIGKPNSRRKSDVPITGIERTTVLVTQGIYRYIRHPMYASGVYGAWGVFFKDPSWMGVILAVGSSVFWGIAAKNEEEECIRYFGQAYREYARQSSVFIPFLF